ncbi:MAG: hypothetical protein M0Z99_01990 [Betaproteobacteria bacterium]|nr:hypothetical protein [Betaproteobacteria bacterium]
MLDRNLGRAAVDFFDTLLAQQESRPADKRLVWIRGFKAALEVSGCLNRELRKRVAAAEERALDDAVAVLAVDVAHPKVTEGETA